MPSGHRIKWPQYDQLMRDELPHQTVESFTKQYLPHISSKAVGARARKLGITPKHYTHPLEVRRQMSIAHTKVTPQMIDFMRHNIDGMSRVELSKHLGIDTVTVARAINANGIKLSEAGKMRARTKSATGCIGRPPWNKGKKLPPAMLEKIAIARQNQSGKRSRIQSVFYRLLDEFGIKYFDDTKPECRFGPWTFDCRIVDRGRDILVEIQGNWIHTQPKNMPKDKAKATYMQRYHPNIPIYYVWEHEFGAENRVKSLIKNWLGTEIPQVDFAFDNVVVERIDKDEAVQFLDTFHYIGGIPGRLYICAKLNGKIIAVSLWSAPSRVETATRLGTNQFKCLELRRFAIHDAYHKKNFASWFLSKSEKRVFDGIEVLVSFADPSARHVGTIYKAAGWKQDGMASGSYFYLDQDGYSMHKKTLFNRAHSMHMKEAEFADKYGYRKIPVPEKFRFVKYLHSNLS